jgi:hypothetical protein
MKLSRYYRMLALVAAGGAVFQTTTSCEETVAPIVAQVVESVIIAFIEAALASATGGV